MLSPVEAKTLYLYRHTIGNRMKNKINFVLTFDWFFEDNNFGRLSSIVFTAERIVGVKYYLNIFRRDSTRLLLSDFISRRNFIFSLTLAEKKKNIGDCDIIIAFVI